MVYKGTGFFHIRLFYFSYVVICNLLKNYFVSYSYSISNNRSGYRLRWGWFHFLVSVFVFGCVLFPKLIHDVCITTVMFKSLMIFILLWGNYNISHRVGCRRSKKCPLWLRGHLLHNNVISYYFTATKIVDHLRMNS